MGTSFARVRHADRPVGWILCSEVLRAEGRRRGHGAIRTRYESISNGAYKDLELRRALYKSSGGVQGNLQGVASFMAFHNYAPSQWYSGMRGILSTQGHDYVLNGL